jgi:flagellin
MSVINTNIAGKIATNAIIRNDRLQEIAMERLSTGLRINSAKDDAAGLAISERMRAEVSGLEMATRNANDGISLLETAEGATLEIANILQRMRELAVQSASGTYSNTDREALDLEFGQLMTEIQRIASQTTWNTMSILNGNDVTTSAVTVTNVNIQLGKNTAQTMALALKSFDPRNAIRGTAVMQTLTPVRAFTAGATVAAVAASVSGFNTLGNDNHQANDVANTKTIDTDTTAFGSAVLFAGNAAAADTRIDIMTQNNSGYALTQLDLAITAVSAERAKYGAYISRLQHAGDNLLNVAQNQDQSRSRIEDADYAIETSELARTQIIAQASTAMLAQANQAKQTVLTLLK